tara:strand:+ start:511 stop:672 length:162 start_codon:yes stop_codon:yes gene_type:complete
VSRYKKIEIVVPQHIADELEQKLPLKRAIKKIVDSPESRIQVMDRLVGSTKEI